MIKTKYFFLVAILFSASFFSCRKPADYHPALYFTGTEQSPAVKFTVDGPTNYGVSVTSSVKVNKDITVNIQLKPELIDAYNSLKGTTYKPLPQGSYQLPTTSVVISNGSSVSAPAMFSITSLNDFQEGVTYCVPIS